MNAPLARRLALLAVLPALVLLAACDRHPQEPHHGTVPAGAELLDHATGDRLAVTHAAGATLHWEGELPALRAGDELAVRVRFLRADGGEIQLGGEYTVRARLAEQGRDGEVGTPGIVELAEHGDHVDVTGVAPGETYVVFDLWHGSHADWSTPAIRVAVTAADA